MHGTVWVAKHLPGKQNVAANAISRGNLPLFFHQVPTAAREPTLIRQELVEIIGLHPPDWTSLFWRTQLANILSWVLLHRHNAPTEVANNSS